MSTRTMTCVVIVCDGCGDELADLDGTATIHWPTRTSAATDGAYGWTVGTDEHGPDLCPACQCQRDGHEWELLRGHSVIRACCAQCGTFDLVAA